MVCLFVRFISCARFVFCTMVSVYMLFVGGASVGAFLVVRVVCVV